MIETQSETKGGKRQRGRERLIPKVRERERERKREREITRNRNRKMER